MIQVRREGGWAGLSGESSTGVSAAGLSEQAREGEDAGRGGSGDENT